MGSIPLYKHTALVVAVQFLILAFLVFQTSHLLYYDELLHAVSAQRLLQGDCMASGCYHAVTPEILGHEIGVHRVPLFILYYVGAIKTYLLSFWFLLFGSNIITLRLFTALCGALVSGCTYYFVARFISVQAAFFTIIFLMIDPTFVHSRIFDWGPVSTQDLLKMFLLVITFSLSQKKSHPGLVLFGLVSAILLWDKMNAWWIILPLLLFILYRYREGIRPLESIFVGFMLGALPLLLLLLKRPWFYEESLSSFAAFEHYALGYYDKTLAWNLLSNYVSDWSLRVERLWEVVSGVAISHYILSVPMGMITSFPVVLGYTLSLLFIHPHKRLLTSLLFITLCSVVLIFVTPHANAIHHFIIVYPILHILVGSVMSELWSRRRILVSIVIALTIISNSMVLWTFWEKSKKPEYVHIYWRADRLQRVTDRLVHDFPQRKVAALDWGISLPVAFLSNGSVAIEDIQPFYEARCQEIAKKAADGYIFTQYEFNDQVFHTYYQECRGILHP